MRRRRGGGGERGGGGGRGGGARRPTTPAELAPAVAPCRTTTPTPKGRMCRSRADHRLRHSSVCLHRPATASLTPPQPKVIEKICRAVARRSRPCTKRQKRW
ncbi:hypothetical protein PVAP13_2KG217958 [Panicum virgatum]|uniref:Uncharacterized protein n=1 Tax=Panicum virgatum TaxID=38727 RepID=A0A8T0W399_PANVG|nr:hypothetical protein PVAP13_2KG217958 [Panicum virgatum]